MNQPHSRPTYVQLDVSHHRHSASAPVHVRVWMDGPVPMQGHVELTYSSERPGRFPDQGKGQLPLEGSTSLQIAPGEVTIRARYVPAEGSVWMASTATRRLKLV